MITKKDRFMVSRLQGGKYLLEDHETGAMTIFDDYIKAIKAQGKAVRRVKADAKGKAMIDEKRI